MTVTEERWLPVPGWDGYLVSDWGNVYSQAREIQRSGRIRSYRRAGRYLKPSPNDDGHLTVNLHANGRPKRYRIHQLVMLAFIGPPPDGMEVCHRDDDPANNQLANLRYGTRSANRYDAVRNGRHPLANRTRCINDHEYTEANTLRNKRGHRSCRACKQDSKKRSRKALSA